MRSRCTAAVLPAISLALFLGRGRRKKPKPAPFPFIEWTTALTHVHPVDSLPWTPTLTCEPPAWPLMGRFDLLMVPVSPHTEADHCLPVDGQPWVSSSPAGDVQTVWAAPHALPMLLEVAASTFDPGHADRVVVFSGTEMPLSRAFGSTDAERAATVAQLRRYFGRILYQTKDIALEHVRLAPMGLGWGYMLRVMAEWLTDNAKGGPNPYQRFADWATEVFTANISNKTRGVLASWGKAASWLEDPEIYEKLPVLESLGRLLPPSNSSLQATEAGYWSRKQLRAWAASPRARAAAVEHRSFGCAEWWRELRKYRFLLCPFGSGIQTSKAVEALLVLTVPIVQRMGFVTYDELAELGFPIVVVERWEEVTPDSTAEWWQALSPRLESFRRNCLTVEGYWRMYTGLADRCV